MKTKGSGCRTGPNLTNSSRSAFARISARVPYTLFSNASEEKERRSVEGTKW